MAGPEVRTAAASVPPARAPQADGIPGVRAGSTAVFAADPEAGSLAYRGYPVRELCRRYSFEEVAYLLWHGELPTREQVFAQNRAEHAHRALATDIAHSLADQLSAEHPMDILRTTVHLLGAGDQARLEVAPAATRAAALRMYAVLPSVIAMGQRHRQGLGAVAPRNHLGFAANFLYMTFGKVPEPQVVAAFETSLILCAGHSPGAAVAGTISHPGTSLRSDVYSSVEGVISEFGGSPQAGNGDAIAAMMNEIAIPDNAKPWVEETLAGGQTVFGFGHRVFRHADPRVPAMRAALGVVAAIRGRQDVLEVYDALTEAVYDATGLRPNLDITVGLAYHLIGFDASAFKQILVAACLPGWTASIVDWLAADSFIGR